MDTEYIGDRKESKSISSYIFTLGGIAVSQRYKKQTTIVFLTAEAKYIALYYTTKEAV